MLVYGDAVRRERAADKLDRIAAMLDLAAAAVPGLQRHSLLVSALVEAGELAQGIADRAFHAAGEVDRASRPAEAALAITMALARRCARSWASAFADVDAGADADDGSPLRELERRRPLLADGEIDVKQPEGYAFYALYPESYYVAARALPPQRWQVIGVRSIGTSLACMVAAGLGAASPITVRPKGPAFTRTVATDPARIDGGAEAYALVDEGPGLSGSSLAAVASWLLDAGVAEHRIHFFASHRQGPGPHASEATRSLWARAGADARVHATSFDDLVLHAAAPAHRLETWLSTLIGPLVAPLREVGGGAWRDLQRRAGDAALPPVHPWQERRKFVALAEGAWLVKFNGLGARAMNKLARAQALAGAGFTAEPRGCCHGFIVERWHGDAVVLPERLSSEARPVLLERIAGYLAFRMRFAAPADSGASIAALAAMARRNSEEALDASAAEAWARWTAALPALAAAVRPIETDNRMHRWEWLAVSGSILKTDALDHCSGHDLIGCQDVAWDVAGAAAEFELSEAEQRALAERIGALAGVGVSAPLVRFYDGCYAAFQLGYYDDAARSAGATEEAPRLHAARARYAERLRRVLASAAFRPSA
jgi:hypothetical protein